MILKIEFLLFFSLFAINSVCGGGGSGVTFTITNEEAPGTRPSPSTPIPDLIEGGIGRDYYTKIDGNVYIQADYSVDGTPEEEVQIRWFKDGVPIEFNLGRVGGDDPPVFSFSITSSIGLFPGDDATRVYQDNRVNSDGTATAFLYLPNIDARFAGRYTFEVFSGDDTASASSNVIPGIPPVLITTPPGSIDPPRENFREIDLNLLSESRVTCDTGFEVYATFDGYPAPTVVCTDTLRDGEQVSQSNTNSQQTSVKYTVPALPASTQTVVTCTATNPHGTASKSITLSSFGTPPRFPSSVLPARVACSRADAVVAARVNEIGCGLLNNGQVTITHSLDQEGIPPSAVTWFHKDNFDIVNEVTDAGCFTITRRGAPALTIYRLQPEDEGEYFITAENCVGFISTESVSTRLELFRKPMIQQPIVPSEGSCPGNPNYTTINAGLGTFMVTDNRPVCITCPSTGDPNPVYSWIRDGGAFVPTQGPSNAAFLDTTGLIFRDQPNCFTCSATNIAGVDTSEVCIHLNLQLAYKLRNNGCTKTCGGGVIDYSLICVEIVYTVQPHVNLTWCIEQQIPRPPIPITLCSAIPCAPQFLLGVWSTCSSSCDDDVRTRTVKCRQIGADGIQRFVGISVCENANLIVPKTSEACPVRRTDDFTPCGSPKNYAFLISEWSSCSHSCQEGRRTRTVRCREIDRMYGGFGAVDRNEVCIRSGLEEPAALEICGSGPCNNNK